MCYNISQYHEFGCTHVSSVKRQTVDCNRKDCWFSSMHETRTHDCGSTCRQTMLSDQRIVTHAHDVKCSRCIARTSEN